MKLLRPMLAISGVVLLLCAGCAREYVRVLVELRDPGSGQPVPDAFVIANEQTLFFNPPAFARTGPDGVAVLRVERKIADQLDGVIYTPGRERMRLGTHLSNGELDESAFGVWHDGGEGVRFRFEAEPEAPAKVAGSPPAAVQAITPAQSFGLLLLLPVILGPKLTLIRPQYPYVYVEVHEASSGRPVRDAVILFDYQRRPGRASGSHEIERTNERGRARTWMNHDDWPIWVRVFAQGHAEHQVRTTKKGIVGRTDWLWQSPETLGGQPGTLRIGVRGSMDDGRHWSSDWEQSELGLPPPETP